MSYQKKLDKYYGYLKQNNGITSKINSAKQEYNSSIRRGNGEKQRSKAKSRVTRLEKQLNRTFEQDENKFVIYQDNTRTKTILEVTRYKKEDIDRYLDLILSANTTFKNEVLKTKYEILFDLINMDKTKELIDRLDELTNNISTNDKIIHRLLLHKSEKKNALNEELNEINLLLEQVKANLKDREENKELRREQLKEYNKLLNRKQQVHNELNNIDIIEFDIGERNTKNNIELEGIQELSEEEEEDRGAAEEKVEEL